MNGGQLVVGDGQIVNGKPIFLIITHYITILRSLSNYQALAIFFLPVTFLKRLTLDLPNIAKGFPCLTE